MLWRVASTRCGRLVIAHFLLDLKTPAAPVAILDASQFTDMRTGAVTAIGAKFGRGKASKALGHIGERAPSPIGMCVFSTVSLISTRSACIRAAPRAATSSPRGCHAISAKAKLRPGRRYRGRDLAPCSDRPMLKTLWIKKETFVVPYGTMSAIEFSLTPHGEARVDDWRQWKGGEFGSLRAHVEAGKLSERMLHAEMGEMVSGLKRARERGRDHPVLASRSVALRYCARPRHPGEGRAPGGIGQRLRLPESCRATTAAARDRAGTICPAVPSRHRGSMWRCPAGHRGARSPRA
ncbi:ornithine cyclodeaminase [Rhizobiales bacterium GAS188]|nr:ornithine cyclodeaminase [Rhizobiales bacterium GAS188]